MQRHSAFFNTFFIQCQRLSVQFNASLELQSHVLTMLLLRGTRGGHPWVGSSPILWISQGAIIRRDARGTDAETRARMDGWIARDRAMLAADIRKKHPDIILVDRARFDVDGLLAESPDLAGLIGQYRIVSKINGIDLMLRHDLAAGNAKTIGDAGDAP